MRHLKDITGFVNGKAVFCGIDVHQKSWNLSFRCDGEVVESYHMSADYENLRKHLKHYDSARHVNFAYEAGFSGFWLYRRLDADGFNCVVTPPNKMHKTGDKVKTNRRDADTLASHLSAGLLKKVWVPPKQVESDRRVNRRRGQLMKNKRRVQCQIKSFLSLHELKRPSSISKNWTKAYLQWLADLEFEYSSDAFTLKQLLKTYSRTRDELAEVTRFIRKLSRSELYEKNFKHVTVLRGIGLITGMTLLLEIYDFERFQNSDRYSSFLGMTPSQYSTGPYVKFGHITRQGNAHLRNVLVESAWTVIRHDPVLREKYQRIRARSDNGKKAIVAVARSLAVRLRRCIVEDTDYHVSVC